MKKWISIGAIAFSFFASLAQAEVESLLLFGDSYFDTGAGNKIAASLGLPLPNPTPPYFNGRHSDGPIWIDYVSSELKIPFVSYAVSGSETGEVNLEEQLGGVHTQLLRYFETELPESQIHPRKIAILNGGSCDFFNLLNNPSKLNPGGICDIVVQAITNQLVDVLTLQMLGYKKIVIWNLINMGALPIFTDPAYGLTALAPLYTCASEAYNTALLHSVRELNRTSDDDERIYIFDAFKVFNLVAADLKEDKINLTEHTITILPEGSFVIKGPQPEHLAFYDQVHPTTLAWKKFAKYMSAFLEDIDKAPRIRDDN